MAVVLRTVTFDKSQMAPNAWAIEVYCDVIEGYVLDSIERDFEAAEAKAESVDGELVGFIGYSWHIRSM